MHGKQARIAVVPTSKRHYTKFYIVVRPCNLGQGRTFRSRPRTSLTSRPRPLGWYSENGVRREEGGQVRETDRQTSVVDGRRWMVSCTGIVSTATWSHTSRSARRSSWRTPPASRARTCLPSERTSHAYSVHNMRRRSLSRYDSMPTNIDDRIISMLEHHWLDLLWNCRTNGAFHSHPESAEEKALCHLCRPILRLSTHYLLYNKSNQVSSGIKLPVDLKLGTYYPCSPPVN